MCVLMLTLLLALPEPSVPPATLTITKTDATLTELLTAIEQQTDIKVDSSVEAKPLNISWNKEPFWAALQSLADATGTRIALRNQGKTIKLVERGDGKIVADVSGPFRIVVDEVISRFDLATGRQSSDIALTIHWQPTFPVFRISTEPMLETIQRDDETSLKIEPTRTRAATRGFVHSTRITLPGIPRNVKTITTLNGHFRVTAATRMIPFRFKTLTAIKATPSTDSGVSVTLSPARKVDGRWEFRLVADYPEGMPIFESFESWVTKNRFTLTAPTGQAIESTDWDIPEQTQRIVAVYRFPMKEVPTLTGWSATYTTPTPLIEFDVPFKLTAIPLP